LPIFQEEKANAQAYFFEALKLLMNEKRVFVDDMVAYLSGSHGEGGGTTFLEINKVEDILNKADKYLLPSFLE
jgi:pyruvate kinase